MTGSNQIHTPATGGVVLALPRDRVPEAPLAAAGITPGDFQPLDNQTIAAIHELGGAVARVQGDGQFDLIVDGNRGYFLLGVVKVTGAAPPVPDSKMQFLKGFFQPVQKLTSGSRLGWQKFRSDDDMVDLSVLLVEQP